MPTAKKKPKAAVASTGLPHFDTPLWGNAYPQPIAPPPDATPELAALFAPSDIETEAWEEDIDLPEATLLALFTGPLLHIGESFWQNELIDALDRAQKREQKAAYDRAEQEVETRERLIVWLAARLCETLRGRARLLEVAAGDGDPRAREVCAQHLLGAPFSAEVAARLDPTAWVGEVTESARFRLAHTYAVGVAAGLVADPAAACARFAPILDRAATTPTLHEVSRATSILWGLGVAAKDLRFDGRRAAALTSHAIPLIGSEDLGFYTETALEYLPHEPRVLDTILDKLGPLTARTSWTKPTLRLFARSTDPAHVPWLAGALGSSGTYWSPVIRGLGSIGDARGLAVIRRWFANRPNEEHEAEVAPIIAALVATHGEPTAEQLDAAQLLLDAGDAAKAQKKKTARKR